MQHLRHASVVITGASSGMGLAMARAFARQGADLVLAARRRELLQRAAQDCERLGGRALAVPTDVTDATEVRRLADAASSAFGRIDVWVNNAGMSLWGPFASIPLEAQTRLVEVNLAGAVHGAHAALPHMLRNGGRGVIINVVSIGGRVPMPWAATYSATKFGLAGFTEALRDELAACSDIKVCGVYPAFTDTPTNLHSANYTGRALRPVPPVVDPERVAEVVVQLAVRPRRATPVGSLHALAPLFALAPDLVGRLAGRWGQRYFLQSGPQAPTTPGALFEPVRDNLGVHGGWGEPERAELRRVMGRMIMLAGVLGAAAFALAGSSAVRRPVGHTSRDRAPVG
jgi:short-subunit dehydrogenase